MEIELGLIEQVQAGDQKAFTQLVLNYSSYVYRTAFAFLHNELEAEDASQEIFLKVYRSIHQLNDVHAFPAWFKKVITTICLDRMKGKQLDLVPDSNIESISTATSDHWDRQIELREALGKLSLEERETVAVLLIFSRTFSSVFHLVYATGAAFWRSLMTIVTLFSSWATVTVGILSLLLMVMGLYIIKTLLTKFEANEVFQ